ncbi:FkbM family methyltransferase [Mucilaginibacter sp. UR6-11]|uniref:FkbM family methyltransferase n=1 Tax=Mucilaginibacter sp. UR6-11 TaxID=1435644 RepID=UPI001E60AE83|nr:FkbM family methyltransferase [Mucilaginibacter sp. UR6-11]MCC8423974.1 FkbM family methyltransferase [Mucilaginibacter sp. UR6-11]
MKEVIRRNLQSVLYFFHRTFFPTHYRKITELFVPNLFKIEKIKLGREGDGTYILPKNIINQDNVLMGLGVADDISFEEDFIKLYPKTTVYAFDPSIAELPGHNDKIIFQSKGVAGKDSKKKNMVSFDTIIKENSIEKQIIVKMDIEGWEWGIFNKLNLIKYDIPVIVIEFHMMELTSIYHWLFFPYHFWKRLNILRKILNQYYIFHLHANNYGYTQFKDFSFPWLCEMTLVNKKLFYDEIISETKILNTINVKERVDIQYPFFK